MKFISILIFSCIFFGMSCCRRNVSDILPEYKLIKTFAKKIEPISGLSLRCYGANNNLPKGHQFKNSVKNFSMSFALFKTQQDTISLEEARCLLVSVMEGFLHDVNTNLEIRSLLDVYPFTSNLIDINLYFQDKNSIDLGTGISTVYLSEDKIKYKHYEIREYRSKYPSVGTHSIVHQESYADALEIVKQEGSMIDLGIANIAPANAFSALNVLDPSPRMSESL